MTDESLLQHSQELFKAIFASAYEETGGEPISTETFHQTIQTMDPTEEEQSEFQALLDSCKKLPNGKVAK